MGVGTQDGLRGAGVLLPPGGALAHLRHRVRSTGEAESGPARVSRVGPFGRT